MQHSSKRYTAQAARSFQIMEWILLLLLVPPLIFLLWDRFVDALISLGICLNVRFVPPALGTMCWLCLLYITAPLTQLHTFS